MPLFQKILVANRGEIACRVFRSAKAMGIGTVAVYSDADKDALHVREADEAVYIGAAPATDSYLVIDKIIDACRQTGADAVHPGYGFLSERAEFCERLKAEGITFIGPDTPAIESMGDKITSKKIAKEAGVNVVPGTMGLIEDAEEAVKIARDIGYPVMIKASAGGGGKGMRIAWDDDQAREGFDRSKAEAASSFGDDRIFIEKFVTSPRHIEIQVLADAHGNCIYLGERECSIQRRNQKVIEEAPSPFLDDATRKAMGEQSVALAKAVDYRSAGTVEFIVDGDRNFYFLEMNTRLQVEHPVTEMVTGVDLVEQMIRVAAGETLTIGQSDVTLNGWALEARIYAEDPYRNFLPSTGRLSRYRPVASMRDGTLEVRNETGVYEGAEISMFYDPMIAKFCVSEKTRASAIDAMAEALNRYEIEGVSHNKPFVQTVLDQKRFQDGALTTAYIDDEFPMGFDGNSLSEAKMAWLAQAAILIGGNLEQVAVINRVAIAYDPAAGGQCIWQHKGLATVQIGGQTAKSVQVERAVGGYRLRVDGFDIVVKVVSARVAELYAMMPEKQAPDTSNMLLCPMPGLVVKLMVAEGDSVEEGQSLAIVEAMKMQNVLRAEKPAKIEKIHAAEGDSLMVDAVIMEFAS